MCFGCFRFNEVKEEINNEEFNFNRKINDQAYRK